MIFITDSIHDAVHNAGKVGQSIGRNNNNIYIDYCNILQGFKGFKVMENEAMWAHELKNVSIKELKIFKLYCNNPTVRHEKIIDLWKIKYFIILTLIVTHHNTVGV